MVLDTCHVGICTKESPSGFKHKHDL